MIDVVTFNVWVGQPPDQLRDNLTDLAEDTGGPVALALQEAKRFDGTLPGYERVACDDGDHPDDSGMVLLVRRRGVEILHRHIVRVDGPWWTGPKHGQRHPPKVFPGVTIEADGRRWVLLDVHRTPGGPRSRNPKSWAAEHDTLREWANTRHDGRPLGMFGDWNGRRSDLMPLAREIGGDVGLRGIDGALTRDCRARARELDRKYGSDAHRPVVVTLTTEGETP